MNSVMVQNQYIQINCTSKHKKMNHQKEKENNPVDNCIKKNKIPSNKFNQGLLRPAHWTLSDIDEENEEETNK